MEMLLLMFPDRLDDPENVAREVEARRDTAAGEQLRVKPWRFSFVVAPSAPAFRAGEITESAGHALRAVVELPVAYPSVAKPHPIVRYEGPSLQREVLSELLRVSSELLAEQAAGSEVLHALLTAAESCYQETMQHLAEEASSAEAERLLAEQNACADVASLIRDERVLGRRCIYYHHILGVGKRQCIAAWARQFRINGWAKIGYPGILIVEGPECTVAEYVRWLQRLRWKLMVVRGEERIDIRDTPGGTIDGARVIPDHGVIEMIDASEIAARARAAGLTDLFLTSMKVHR